MAKNNETVLLYVVSRGRFADDESPMRIFTAEAKPVPSGYVLVNGREQFGFRTRIRKSSNRLALTLEDAMREAQMLAKDKLAHALQEQKDAERDIDELNRMSARLKKEGKCPNCRQR